MNFSEQEQNPKQQTDAGNKVDTGTPSGNQNRKRRARKKRTAPLWLAVLAWVLVVACATAAVWFYIQSAPGGETVQSAGTLAARGYYPLRQSMEAGGYTAYKEGDSSSYVKRIAGQSVIVTFDLETGQCTKNGYTFDLTNQWLTQGEETYILKSTLEDITCHTLQTGESGAITATPVEYAPHEWTTAFPPLIAHAGGGLRKAHANQDYSNGLNAVIQNYDLGHRVFEIDFQLTTDGGLAAVHEGIVPGDENGISMTQAEWLAYTGIGDIHPMLIGDVLDQMAVNEDMFLVTDTKADDATPFEVIYEEAEKRDLSLLDRVIPQIYNREMYDSVMEVYDFPSIIFTTYMTGESPDDVIAFCEEKDNIRVATIDAGNESLLDSYLEGVAEKDILIYTYTLNQYTDIAAQRQKGVHGLYTDYLLPADYDLYDSLQPVQEEQQQ